MTVTVGSWIAPSRALAFGLLLIAPAALFGLANVLNDQGIGFLYALWRPFSEPPRQQIFNLVSPVVFLGGLATALLLNVMAIARLELRWEHNELVSSVSIQPRMPNAMLILTAALMLVALILYAVVENFSIVSTHVA